MKALISTVEPIIAEGTTLGYRVAQVLPDNQTFSVATTLYWMQCPPDIRGETHYYNPSSNTFELIPQQEKVAAPNQPNTSGTTTL